MELSEKPGILGWFTVYFWTSEFGLTRVRRLSVDLVECDDAKHWFAIVLHMFHVLIHPLRTDAQEFPFVCYFGVTPLVDDVDRFLNFLYVKCATGDEMDHAVSGE